MMNRKLFIVVLLHLFFVSLVSAATLDVSPHFPRGCEVSGFGYSKNFLIINEHGDQMFYLFQNRSHQTIELEHFETQADVFMSPKLETQISPDHWSAFASDVSNLYFQCFVKHQTSQERQSVDCSEVLDVCQYPRVKFALSNMGNYWVSTNKEQGQVIKDAVAKGILLRW